MPTSGALYVSGVGTLEIFSCATCVAVLALVWVLHFGPWGRGGKRHLPSPYFGGLPTSLFGRFGGHTFFLAAEAGIDNLEAYYLRCRRPFYINSMNKDIVVVGDPEEVRRILNGRPAAYARAPLELSEVMEKVKYAPFLFASEGQAWARFRRLAIPSFSARNVERGLPSVQRIADRLVSKWSSAADNNSVVSALPDLRKTMHDIIALVGCGLDTNSIGAVVPVAPGGVGGGVGGANSKPEVSTAASDTTGHDLHGTNGGAKASGAENSLARPSVDTYAAKEGALDVLTAMIHLPWHRITWDHFPWASWVRKFKAQQAGFDEVIRSLIEEEKARQDKAGGVDADAEKAEGVLLRNLIAALDDQAGSGSGGGSGGSGSGTGHNLRAKLSDTEVLYNLKGFFVIGTDTVAIVIAWCLYHFASNAALQAKAQKEVDSASLPMDKAAASNGRFCTQEVAASLVFLRAAIQEALRLHNPVPAPAVCNTQHVTVQGETYPPGWSFWLLTRVHGLQDDSFSRAAEFIPERWLSPQERAAALGFGDGGKSGEPNHRPDSIFPFGYGPRGCPGQKLAVTQAAVILATIVSKLEVSLEPDHGPPGTTFAFTMNPKKVNLMFKQRITGAVSS